MPYMEDPWKGGELFSSTFKGYYRLYRVIPQEENHVLSVK